LSSVDGFGYSTSVGFNIIYFEGTEAEWHAITDGDTISKNEIYFGISREDAINGIEIEKEYTYEYIIKVKPNENVTIKTAGTYCDRDIILEVDTENITGVTIWDGTFTGNGETEKPQGYNVSLRNDSTFAPGTTFFSLDDGITWTDFYDFTNGGNYSNPILNNITQIKFKAISYESTNSAIYGKIASDALTIELVPGRLSTLVSENIIVTQDIADLWVGSFIVTISGGGSDD
jgi:hypothetical protein